jgi:hypothetical protein
MAVVNTDLSGPQFKRGRGGARAAGDVGKAPSKNPPHE